MFENLFKCVKRNEEERRDSTGKESKSKLPNPERKCFRVVIMGTAGVGKTALINRFLYASVAPTYLPTVEELFTEQLELDHVTQDVQILDTTGSYSFPAMRKLAIARGDAFVLVYAVNNIETFETVKILREEIKEVKGTLNVPIVVVGNKIDLYDGQDNRDWAVIESVVSMDWDFAHVFTSATMDINVDQVFMRAGKIKSPVKTRPQNKRRVSLPVPSVSKARDTGGRSMSLK